MAVLLRETRKPRKIKFVYEVVAGADPRTPTGKRTLFIDGAQVGQGTVDKTVPGMFSVSEPFDVGIDNGGSVDRKEYSAPSKFSDTLNWVRFDLVPLDSPKK